MIKTNKIVGSILGRDTYSKNNTVPTFYLRNYKTGETYGNYTDVKRARTARDRLDNEYGAYVWKVVER